MAARWRGYKDEEFELLPVTAQARIIAAYRLDSQIQGVLAQERVRKMNSERGS